MKINIKREGGFMGMIAKASIDFSKMTDEERAKVESLINKATDPASNPEPKPAAYSTADAAVLAGDSVPAPALSDREIGAPNPYLRDGFSYSFSFRKDGKMVKYTYNDTTAPPQLLELFEKYVAY